MNNLENSVKDCISKELEKGIIEKVISEQLESCVKESVKDLFSWNGALKKVIEDKVKSVMIPYLENYNYSEYITKLDDVLVQILNTTTSDNKKILENFKELMTTEEIPKEVKITDIYDKWESYVEKKIDRDKIDNYDYEGGCINVNLNVEQVNAEWSDYDKYVVAFECEEDEEFNIEFMITRWKKYDKKFNLIWEQKSELKSLRYLNDFEIYMMKLKQVYVNIDLDKEYSNDEIFIEYEE